MRRVIIVFGWLAWYSAALGQAPDFGRDILPILSDKCFHCHGPDAGARKAGLRFDTKEGAFRVKKGHAVIIPGKSADSELIQRVFSKDDTEVMPPREANRTLSDKQHKAVRRSLRPERSELISG